jgi:hypothetical protein
MKRNPKLLAIILACLPLMGCSTNKTSIDVIIMSGQSNMVGCSTYSRLSNDLGSAKYSEYASGYKGIKISYDCWTKNGTNDYAKQNSSNDKFVTTLLGEGNSDLTFGPEVGMAEKFSATRNDKVVLIKYACGASNLLDDWAAPDSGKRTTMYANFVAYVTAQMKLLSTQGYDPKIKAMCWMQGEGDSWPVYCEEYYQQEHYLVSDLRKEFAPYTDGTDFAFVDGGISDSPSEEPKYQTVNAAKQQVAAESERNIYIDTLAAGLDKSKLQEDAAHYIAPAMLTLGHLFADAVAPFLTSLKS